MKSAPKTLEPLDAEDSQYRKRAQTDNVSSEADEIYS